MSLRVGLIGATGRMGQSIERALATNKDLDLVAQIGRDDSLVELLDSRADVAIDVTSPSSVMANVEYCIRNGVHLVVGTSGIDEDRLEAIMSWSTHRPDVGVLIAPSFSIAAVLMMEFAARAAPHFESVEIVESHHPDKLDAPSGTARRTAELVAAARRGMPPMPDRTSEGIGSARGAKPHGIPIHSLRVRGIVAEQEVVLGAPGETLHLRHVSTDRSAFMPGVMLALRWVGQHPGVHVGLECVLDLA